MLLACGAAIVFVAVLLAFLPTLRNGFVFWDDDVNLLDNPAYRGLSLAHLRWMFTTTLMGPYQPLSWLTLGLDYVVWGMNPRGYHLTSLLLHTAGTVALFVLLVAMLERERERGSDLGVAAAAVAGALFWGIHPLRVESVAWATERRDVLSGPFFVLTVLAYVRMAEAQRLGRPWQSWFVASLVSYLLSLLAKASGMMLPIVLLVLDAYPLRRLGRDARGRAVLEKLPYAALAGAAALIAFRGQAALSGMRPLAGYGALERAAQAAYGLCFYLWKSVAPVGLSALYLLPRGLDPAAPRYLVSMLAVVSVTLALIRLRHRWPWALAAWACYVVLIAPLLGLVQTGPQLVADRFSYLPSLPASALVAAGVHRLLAAGARRRVTLPAAAAALAVLGILTARQTATWRDSFTLFGQMLAVDPANHVALAKRGWLRQQDGDLDGAQADYSEGIRHHPDAITYFNRASLELVRGQLDAAIADYSECLRLNPGDPRTLNNRGMAHQEKGDWEGAAADFAEALRLAPPGFAGRALIEKNLATARGRLPPDG